MKTCFKVGNRVVDKNLGYILVYAPMHPHANTRGYVYEHRLVVEVLSIDRVLNKDEVVHHKNGDRKDNVLSNLEVMSRSEHAILHAKKRKGMRRSG